MIAELAQKIPRLITVEENVLAGGFGSAVLEGLADRGITGFNLNRIGIPDQFIEHGSQQFLRTKYGIDAQGIAQAARKLFESDGITPKRQAS